MRVGDTITWRAGKKLRTGTIHDFRTTKGPNGGPRIAVVPSWDKKGGSLSIVHPEKVVE